MQKSKLAELILHIAEKSKDDPNFGATKLNKILFAIDFYSYGHRGETITKAVYIHLSQGPAPKAMVSVVDELLSHDRIEIVEREYFGYKQKRMVPKTGPDLTLFSEDELEFVDQVIQELKSYNATQLSEWTHKLNPWINTLNNEEIPFFSIFAKDNLPVEKTGLIWGREELRKWRKAKGHAV